MKLPGAVCFSAKAASSAARWASVRKLCGDPASGWEPLAASSAAISALVRMLGQDFETVFECLLPEQLQL